MYPQMSHLQLRISSRMDEQPTLGLFLGYFGNFSQDLVYRTNGDAFGASMAWKIGSAKKHVHILHTCNVFN